MVLSEEGRLCARDRKGSEGELELLMCMEVDAWILLPT